MDRIDLLNERIAELQDVVLSLAVSAQYNGAEPVQEFMAKHMIGGHRRAAVNLALGAILARAAGEALPSQPHASLCDQYPSLYDAFREGPISRGEALAILADLLGSEESARELLSAHKQRGFSVAGHQALGL